MPKRARTMTLAAAIACALAQAGRAELIITEILASNTAYVTEFEEPQDLVEIYNTGPDDATLAGPGDRMYLTDDPYGDYRRWWKFPLTTVLKAGEYLTVACDASGKFGLHANFQLNASLGVVALMDADANGRRMIDMVEYDLQYQNVSYARFENGDGTHAWNYTSRPTFFFSGQAVCAKDVALRASPVYCGSPQDLCPPSSDNILEETFIPDIGEFDYSPALVKATDEVTFIARLGPSEARIGVDLHYIFVAPDGTPGREALVPMHDDGQGPDALRDCDGHDIGADDTWWAVTILPAPPGTTVRFWATSYWRGIRPEPDPCRDREPAADYSLYTVENTEGREVRVNEVIAINQTGFRNYRGSYEDWVEIYNAGDEGVDLAGLYLTTTPRNPTQWAFPLNRPELTGIPAHGHIIAWCDEWLTLPGIPELHASFRFDGTRDRIYLANAKGVFDGIDWSEDPRRPCPCDLLMDEQDPDIAIGRVPDGSETIARIDPPTPGAANPSGSTGVPLIRRFRPAPDDPSCEIPCGSPSFVVEGENLANPARVLVDDDSSAIDAMRDVTSTVQTLPDGSLQIFDARCGVGAEKTVWVYQGRLTEFAAAKARFRCLPQITGITPEDPVGDEVVTLDLCGFDVLQSILIDGVLVPFTPDPRPVAAPKKVTLFLAPCDRALRRVRVTDTDGLWDEVFLCGKGEFLRGDATGDGRVNIADPVAIVFRIFRNTPLGCEDAGDPDDDGRLSLSDPIYILAYLFTHGPAPRPPFPGCGADPTPDDGLSCETYVCR